MYKFYEFFAGGGMARIGLGDRWRCDFANDIDAKKARIYEAFFSEANDRYVGVDTVCTRSVADVDLDCLHGRADLAWASFPCQDLSLAGSGAGLSGERSGTFWPFWELIKALGNKGRQPRSVVFENVYGAITSHKGEDFAAISEALVEQGYKFGPMVIDAVHWIPQSRPRLFVVAFASDISVPADIFLPDPDENWHPRALHVAKSKLPDEIAKEWIWLGMPKPPTRNTRFADLVEESPTSVNWHSREETNRLISLMAPLHRQKLDAAVETSKSLNRKVVGGVYKRTRQGRQRAEVRFDDVAGCLRTPAGGSSRQTILVVEGGDIKSRLLSTREAARLMGLPDEYKLPENYNAAYHLAGDGLVVPVVRHIATQIIEPVLRANSRDQASKAA